MAATQVPAEPTTRRPSRRGMALFAAAVLAIAIAAVVGVQGLLRSPIESVAADGIATLHGTWEPYSCDTHACEGYVQAGARSVFVVLHPGCAQPQRATVITVTGRPDATLGSGSYRAIACSVSV